MAQGKRCPNCNTPMNVVSEKKEPAGSIVVYACPKSGCNHKQKTFE